LIYISHFGAYVPTDGGTPKVKDPLGVFVCEQKSLKSF